FHIIIAGSFSDIFYMNCTKNAMLPIVLEKNAREHLAKYVEIDETWKNKLVNGLDDIAITLQYESLIEKYEKSL
ncbi:3-isopropylmalate dehydratase small subunit, partial [Staphylococcus aureus]|nr:3-isopropylmalate dehydratase small subunit [Staphylococcus aureus]